MNRAPAIIAIFGASVLFAQETAAPEAVQLFRGRVVNLVTDPVARLLFLNSKGKPTAELRAPVAIHFPDRDVSICWDTIACRLVYLWTGDKFLTTDPETGISAPAGESVQILAEGPIPISPTIGAYTNPRYFGMRESKEKGSSPEFLYSCGQITIAERFSVSADGKSLQQIFRFENSPADVILVFPESLQGRLSASAGTTKGRFVTLKKAEMMTVTVSFPLSAK
ncbi:MAG: hypothetical protein HKN23_16780 [Verrucomicrobiales bacterium]|nr:hypothetical protein [Verrucomicrobiales bacterium]